MSAQEHQTQRQFDTFFEDSRTRIGNGLALAIGDPGLAGEAVDEALARASSRWETVGGYENPAGWVYRVGLNWARGVLRKRRYEVLTDVLAEPVQDQDLPDLDLLRAMGRLSPRFRQVVVARYYLDWSTAEVAASLGIPEGTVKSRLSRALKRLAAELGEHQ